VIGLRVLSVAALAAATLAIAAAPAPAAYIHPNVTGEYGKEGPKASGLGSGCRISYNKASQRLFVFSDGKVYGLHVTPPGTATPLGGTFPFNTEIGTSCGEPDMDVESGGAGNIYAVQSTGIGKVYGWDSTGSVLPGWPISVPGGGEICGADSAAGGGAWFGNYSQNKVYKYSAAGAAEGTISTGSFKPCKVAVDHVTGDVFAAAYGGGQLVKFTAASGYTTKVSFPAPGAEPGLAVNGAEHRIYVGNSSSSVKVYDTETAALIETMTLPGGGGNGIAVDETTGTVFVTVGSGASGYIQERPGVVVPDVTTSEPTGLATLHGHIDPVGGGEVTSCQFEFSTEANYSGASTAPCEPAPNYAAPQNVTADISGMVVGETLYHFRLKVGNANGFNTSGDRTFTPHFVTGLTNEPASPVTRTSAVLHASYEGTNETTHWYFNYGETTAYGQQTAVPPGAVEGPTVGPTPLSFELTGLTPNHTYHYQIVAENSKGISKSTDLSFTTPPPVPGLATEAATGVTRTTALLHASYEGTNETTHWYFNYGETTSYGKQTAVPPGALENATVGPTPLSFELTGLKANHTYHFQIVAENSVGISKGVDRLFTTPPAVTGVTTDPATAITPTSADLNASFTGDGLNVEYFFEWGSSTKYGEKSAVGEVVAPSGPTSAPPITISGLQPLHTYHYRVVAVNNTGFTVGADRTVVTVSAPVVVALSSSHVTATSADLHAVLNPHEAETEYFFEYGESIGYGSSTPPGTIPAGNADEGVEAHLTGLNGGVYHFRVVAKSIYGETVSEDQTFNFYPPSCPNAAVRQQTGANTLPDCRAYELVTPEDAGSTIIFPASAPFSPTATAPSRVDFGGGLGLVNGAGPALNVLADNYVATRTETGWKTKYVGLPSDQAYFAGGPPWSLRPGEGFAEFRPDKFLTDELFDTSMSQIVQWNDGHPGEGEFAIDEHPDSSNAPYIFDSNTGKQVDRWPTNVAAVPDGEHFKGRTAASADLSHFIFTSNIAFAPGAVPGDMYDNDISQSTLSIVNRRENGQRVTGTRPAEVSSDGSHILMTAGGGRRGIGNGELFMRVDEAVTYDIAPGFAVRYIGMTPDGKKVYFTSDGDLTSDHSDTDTSVDLYMWSETSSSPNHIVRVSKANDGDAGNTNACSASWTNKCNIAPISFYEYTRSGGGRAGSPYSDNFIADNGDIYFLSPEQLHGTNGVPNQENLYDFRNGKLQFVAALDPNSKACTREQGEDICATTAVARMEVTANDSYMSFLTGSKVTGYDNAGHSELYRYAPASEQLICVSCLPSGKAPKFDATASYNGKFLTEDGRTFFNTRDALLPQDTNRFIDVYEFAEGRPQLISTGTNPGSELFGIAAIASEIGLLGVSADGTDVYFSTRDVLVGQDRNGEAVKIYDARSGGGFVFSPPAPPCVAADECHGPSSQAPDPLSNGTVAGLGGSGNLQAPGGKPKKTKRPRHGKKRKAHHGRAHHQRKGAGR
jgi:hypothetical protein